MFKLLYKDGKPVKVNAKEVDKLIKSGYALPKKKKVKDTKTDEGEQ